jgi:hypothetical protein
MGKLIVGLVIGIGLGVVGTLAVQRYRRVPNTPELHQSMLIVTTPLLLERALRGAKALDVSVGSPSTHSVNYVYDELYDVNITYQQSNMVKKIVLPFGYFQGIPITPNAADFVIANDGATIIRRLNSATP